MIHNSDFCSRLRVLCFRTYLHILVLSAVIGFVLLIISMFIDPKGTENLTSTLSRVGVTCIVIAAMGALVLVTLAVFFCVSYRLYKDWTNYCKKNEEDMERDNIDKPPYQYYKEWFVNDV